MSDEIVPRKLNRDESWELTDEIRQGYETIHESRLAQAERLARAYAGYAWEGMGYETFDEYHAEEFGDDLQHHRFELEERISAVKMLADSGMAKTKIAEILGIGRATVYRDLAETDSSVSPETSSEVDAAGQRVEEVGLIEADDSSSQVEPDPTPDVIENPKVSEAHDEESDYEQKKRLDDWFESINFDAMIITPPTQIIEADPTPDEPEYFQPRQRPLRPLEVINPTLPPPPVKAYDDQPELLEPPMKLQKVQDPNKDDSKHCKTCACNLLP